MEPGHNLPNFNLETTPSVERLDVAPGEQPEMQPGRQIEQSPEQAPATHEQSVQPTANDAALAALTTAQPPSTVTAVSDDDTATASLVQLLPDTASDDDNMGKEWVGKIKHIVSETASDPYKRKMAVTALKKDYMRKRYNRGDNAADV